MITTLTFCVASLLSGFTPQSETTAKQFPLHPIEEQILEATNAHRARYGLPPFEMDPSLMESARQHAAWMTTYRSMVHTNQPVAENIAMGQPSPDSVLWTWMNSSGHRANILNPGHQRIGVAAYQTPEGTIFWCQQFTR